MWISDLNKQTLGAGGDLTLRYGISRAFALGLVAGFEDLKSKQSPQLSDLSYTYLKLNAFPVSLVAYFNLAPRRQFSPYLFIGGGMMFYQRLAGTGIYAPDNKFQSTYIVPVGIGLEMFTSKKFSITIEGGFTNFSDKTDLRENKSLDGYVTAKAGINFYLGSSDADDDDSDGLTNGEERRYGTDPNNPDTDGDGLKDGEEVKRYRTNPLRSDTDGDGLSDGDEVYKYHTDPTKFDTDGDGLSDGDEILKYHTNPLKMDTDGDGLTDGEEVLKYKTDPLKVDTDGDGLSDWDEVKVYKTDPNKPDTDGDGLTDGEEVKKYHTNPLKADTDGGGVNDGVEVKRGTNPLDPKDDFPPEVVPLFKGRSVIIEGINFVTGSAQLTSNSAPSLERAYNALVASPDVKLEIIGYTDNVGIRSANEALSLRRAAAVKSWLVKKGIDPSRLTTVGKGPDNPIAPNYTAEGRAKNRRIEFHVMD